MSIKASEGFRRVARTLEKYHTQPVYDREFFMCLIADDLYVRRRIGLRVYNEMVDYINVAMNDSNAITWTDVPVGRDGGTNHEITPRILGAVWLSELAKETERIVAKKLTKKRKRT